MPRKLRLSVHRKNEFRKRALKEQQPLLVSIPRTSLKLDYSMLKRELNSLIKLPKGIQLAYTSNMMHMQNAIVNDYIIHAQLQ